MADEQPQGSSGQPEGGAGGAGGEDKDIAYWKNEARKAFLERDATSKRMREIESKLPTQEQLARLQELEEAARKAEEDRKRKEGEFDSWRASIEKQQAAREKKYTEELAERDGRLSKATERYHQKLIDLAFAASSDWFGEQGKSVLPPDVAASYFARNVEVQDIDGEDVVVVKDFTGAPVVDSKTGKPARFADAIGELIGGLPRATRDRILRGSGKTGSGSAGGGAGQPESVDLRNLTPDRLRDPKVLEALKKALPRNAVVMGTAYEQR